MNELQLLLTIVLLILQFTLPKKWAFLPLLIAAFHTTQAQVIPYFSPVRILIVAGLFRFIVGGDFRWSARNPVDLIILFLGIIAIVTSFFHQPTISLAQPTVSRIRLVIDIVGTFLYAKALITSLEDLKRLAKGIAYVALPLALGLLYTQFTLVNIYSLVGADSDTLIREGRIRAAGPFGTPILAGTVGALIMPLCAMIWRENRSVAKIGIITSLTIIYCSGSSTPIGAFLIGLTALLLWKLRLHMRTILIWSIVVLALMALVKTRPIWYLIALPDFVGGSTGWHRAYLIDMSIKYFDEWWLYGTEYTRHWMPYGLPSHPEHSDLTNYYIHMGVHGGLLLVLAIILIFHYSFRIIKRTLHDFSNNSNQEEFTIWCVGALLFTHMITCLTISYFDQTFVLFYFLIAFISNLHLMNTNQPIQERNSKHSI